VYPSGSLISWFFLCFWLGVRAVQRCGGREGRIDGGGGRVSLGSVCGGGGSGREFEVMVEWGRGLCRGMGDGGRVGRWGGIVSGGVCVWGGEEV
jgi:hypothetical protein